VGSPRAAPGEKARGFARTGGTELKSGGKAWGAFLDQMRKIPTAGKTAIIKEPAHQKKKKRRYLKKVPPALQKVV